MDKNAKIYSVKVSLFEVAVVSHGRIVSDSLCSAVTLFDFEDFDNIARRQRRDIRSCYRSGSLHVDQF